MKKKVVITLCASAVLLIVSCTAGPNNVVRILEITKEPVGFWNGLWHGMISPITLVISLFNDNIGMYEVHNNGGWYNLGFLLGAGGVFGGGIKIVN
jgi:hypothetical protein